MKKFSHALKLLTGALLATVSMVSMGANPALAQATTTSGSDLETVVVTGTNIAGASVVGENLITMGTPEIETTSGDTLIDVLKNVPALANMGQNSQGLHNSDYFEVNIHGIGGSSSASTLVLIDGMRMPLGGSNHSEPDTSILPELAVQHIDVLADGASSVYGADALAGVVNIVTRPGYDGLEVDGAAGYATGYDRLGFNVLWGTHWDNGSAMFAFQHSYESDLELSDRITNENWISKGGLNEDTFYCSPATIQPAGNSSIYLSPTSSTSVSSAQANSPCFYPNGSDYVPSDQRDNALGKFTQQFGKNLTVTMTMLYATRRDMSDNATTTTLQATAFGTGAQANPFYVDPPGVTATSQTVRFSFAGLLPESTTIDGAVDVYGHMKASYTLGDDWSVTADVLSMQDNSNTSSYNELCQACALQALNGSSQTNGSLTTATIPNTTIIANMLPLTTANALDVWDPPSTNKTSAATLASIASGQVSADSINAIEQYQMSVNGTLFKLPAGPLKIAIGVELLNNSLIEADTKADGLGPTSFGSGFSAYHYGRTVKSTYAEMDIPVISPAMHIPLVQEFDLDISGRYDDYTPILGQTANPKFSFDWKAIDGLKFRGSYSTSFVAPQLDSIGDPSQHYLYDASSVSLASSLITFPTKLYPGTAGVLPGCAATAVTCQIGTAAVQGISIDSGIGPNAQPERGFGYSVGFDFAPDYIPGLLTSVTLWDANLRGGVQTIPTQDYFNIPSITQYGVIYPTGATPAQIAGDTAAYPILSTALPSPVYFFINNNQKNIENFGVQGLDLSGNYDFDTDFGHFGIGDDATYLLQWNIAYGFPASGPWINLLNTDGITSQYPQVQLQSRAHVAWTLDGVATTLFMNYTGPYKNLSASAANPPVVPLAGGDVAGGDHVNSNVTFDLHVAYDIPDGLLGGDQVYVDGQNILDKKPPFYSAATGSDDNTTSLIGRVLTLGIRAKF